MRLLPGCDCFQNGVNAHELDDFGRRRAQLGRANSVIIVASEFVARLRQEGASLVKTPVTCMETNCDLPL